MGDTKIEWTDKTYSPLRVRVRQDAVDICNARGWHDLAAIVEKMIGRVGPHCEHVSPGCVHCYAGANNHRRLPSNGTGLPFDKRSRELVEPFVDEKILVQPLRWKEPCKIFVENQSDLFGEWWPFEFIDKVFAVMAHCPQHTFQILTKRPERMLRYFTDLNAKDRPDVEAPGYNAAAFASEILGFRKYDPLYKIPDGLPNVWLGVSVESQEYADKRIPLLLQTPAAIRFVSYEPALGPVNFTAIEYGNTEKYLLDAFTGKARVKNEPHVYMGHPFGPSNKNQGVDWIIAGSESGPKARPAELDWYRSVRDQCQAAGVAFFLKQHIVNSKKTSLPELDGKQWAGFPEVRV